MSRCGKCWLPCLHTHQRLPVEICPPRRGSSKLNRQRNYKVPVVTLLSPLSILSLNYPPLPVSPLLPLQRIFRWQGRISEVECGENLIKTLSSESDGWGLFSREKIIARGSDRVKTVFFFWVR